MQERQTGKKTFSQSREQHWENPRFWEDREPIIVADQHGVVIAWPDKHTSRFFWSDLRKACPCERCQSAR